MKIKLPSMFRLLFVLCWSAYFFTYFGRLNYAAALTEIIRSQGFSKGEAGLVSAGFFMTYGAGQFINGFLGDHLPPKWLIFTGLLGSGIMNLIMSFLSTAVTMTAVWCINGFLQSLIWSPLIRTFTDYIMLNKQKRACMMLNSSMPAGTFCTYILTGGIISGYRWQSVFLVASVLLIIMAVIWMVGTGIVEKHVRTEGVLEMVEETSEELAQQKRSVKEILIRSGILFFCVALVMQGVLKDGVSTWLPTYISEVYHLNASISIITTTIIPLINISGVYLAAYVNTHWLKSETTTSAFFFTICFLAVVLLKIFPDAGIILTLLLFAVATTAMMVVNIMFVSVVPISFAREGKTSTISGILNSSAYLGGAVSSYGIGVISAQYGWGETITIWIICAAIGGGMCMLGRKSWGR